MLAYLYSPTFKLFKVALNIILYYDVLKTRNRSDVAKINFAMESQHKDSLHSTAFALSESLLAISDLKMR